VTRKSLAGIGLATALTLALPACSPEPGAPVRLADGTGGAGGQAPAPPERLPSPPWILQDDLVNARDVGGTVNAESIPVAFGALFRGPPPRLTAVGCAEFERLGIRTVIDLRVASELTSPPECVMGLARVVAAPLPVPYNVSAADYIAILDETPSILEAFRTLGDTAAYPVYTHCTWGRDRTGVLVALVLLALNVPREEILKEYLLSQERVGAYAPSLEAALDEIERRGGIDAYLSSAGVTEAQVAALRQRVLAVGSE